MSHSDKPDPAAAPCSLPSNVDTASAAAIQRSEAEWRAALSPERYRVLRGHGTEPPFRNALWDNKRPGLYLCAGCGGTLFASGQKFDSGTGWPSFTDSIVPENVGRTVDDSFGMRRVEVHCSRCGGHLGHVFDDGPQPTGLRYCINSASLQFVDEADIAQREDLAQHARHAI